MDGWLQNRRQDVRFSNELRRVDMGGTSWYNAGQRVVVSHHTFAATADSNSKPEPTIKKKKKKRMKKTESGNERSALLERLRTSSWN